MSTMLSPSSGSLTARSAFLIWSGVRSVGTGSSSRPPGNYAPGRGPRSTSGRGEHQVGECAPDVAHGGERPPRPRVQTPVGEKNHEQIASRIDPHHGSGPAGVAESERARPGAVD